MSDTPETNAAVDASQGQWSFVLKQTCARLERERNEALEVMHETRRRLDDAWLEIEQLKKDAELLKRQRDDGWQEIKRLTKNMEKWR